MDPSVFVVFYKVTIDQALDIEQYPLSKPDDLFSILTEGEILKVRRFMSISTDNLWWSFNQVREYQHNVADIAQCSSYDTSTCSLECTQIEISFVAVELVQHIHPQFVNN